MNWKKWSIWGVVGTGMGLVIAKYFEQLRDLVTPEVAVRGVLGAWELLIVLLIAVGSIIVSWVITEFFKRVKYPNPDDWAPNKGRLWVCSVVWNVVINNGVLTLRYQDFDLTRAALEMAVYMMVWTLFVAGVGIAAYDPMVKRVWPRIIRAIAPTKWVRTKDDVIEERPADQPSVEGEKTLMQTDSKYSRKPNGSGQ